MRKPGSPREIPPPLELECLKILWKLGEGNVKEVRASLANSRELAYTTVMTLLDRLVRRGTVTRRKSGRSFVYTAAVDRDTLRAAAVKQLLASFFDDSTQSLLGYLGSTSPQFRPVNDDYPSRETERNETLDTALL